MNKSVYLLVCSIILGMTYQSCQKDPYITYKITFENQTGENLYVGWAWHNDIVTISNMFKYGTYELKKTIIFKEEISSTDMYTATGKEFGWMDSEKGEFHMLIYKQSTLDRYSTDELIEQDIYDKRYDLTFGDLQAMNFKIVYTDE